MRTLNSSLVPTATTSGGTAPVTALTPMVAGIAVPVTALLASFVTKGRRRSTSRPSLLDRRSRSGV
eukprot:7870206-Heterocapsa_arctica.AAC.1